MFISTEPFLTIILLQFVEALVTGLVLVAVIGLALRCFKVKGITIRRESE